MMSILAFRRYCPCFFPYFTWILTIACLSVAKSQERATESDPIALWQTGVPGFESLPPTKEVVEVTKSGERNVMNVHSPSLVPYFPEPTKSIGVSIVVAPGGGHSKLCIDHEGHNICKWLADHGVAAYMLKYRLCREKDTVYTLEEHAVSDLERAIRWVRHHGPYKPDAQHHVGAMGFSAGGELVFLASQRDGVSKHVTYDEIEKHSGRPDFQCLIYPGKSHLIEPSSTTPPVFIACGMQDRKDISEGMAEAYLRYKRVGVPAELHIYSGAGHGFGYRSNMKGSVAKWPERLMDWIQDQVLRPMAEKK
jgi:endo-1,4-beta-xylanase